MALIFGWEIGVSGDDNVYDGLGGDDYIVGSVGNDTLNGGNMVMMVYENGHFKTIFLMEGMVLTH